MNGRVTILCDNSVGSISGTLGEHGFAALVEHAGGALLFDTGQGETLLGNALRMNKDLSRVARVALSHGHYDHTGGLLPLLQQSGPKEVYAHPGMFRARYRVKDTGESIAIGITHDQVQLQGAGAVFVFNRDFREIAPGIYLTGEVPRNNSFELGDTGLFLDPGGQLVDPLEDDQSLVIRTAKGLVLLLGCCHAGIINTLEHAMATTGESEIYAIVGGTHLGFCQGPQLELTVAALKKYRVQKVCASHCTGFHASARLWHEFPGKVVPAQVGYTIEI
jgi:7,8-dihydropterin-6-yl-methyl-4-(beta-D-ribofuranosyl)aminobenzene 5'-phosphate synthase